MSENDNEKRPPMGTMTAIDIVDFPIPEHQKGDPPYSIFDCSTRAGSTFASFKAIVDSRQSEILKGTPFSKQEKPRVKLRLVFFVDPGTVMIDRSFLAMPPGIALPIVQNGQVLKPITVAFANDSPIAIYEIVRSP